MAQRLGDLTLSDHVRNERADAAAGGIKLAQPVKDLVSIGSRQITDTRCFAQQCAGFLGARGATRKSEMGDRQSKSVQCVGQCRTRCDRPLPIMTLVIEHEAL